MDRERRMRVVGAALGARLVLLGAGKALARIPEPHHVLVGTAAIDGAPGVAGTVTISLAGGAVALSVMAEDSRGHEVSYAWSASCSGGQAAGSFSAPAARTPVWTAPDIPVGTHVVCVLQAAALDGTGSFHENPRRRIVFHEWDLDYDGTLFDRDMTGATTQLRYGQVGAYSVALRVTDDNVPPLKSVSTVEVTIGGPEPAAVAGGPYLIAEGSDLRLDGSDSSSPGGTCGNLLVSFAGIWTATGSSTRPRASSLVSGMTR